MLMGIVKKNGVMIVDLRAPGLMRAKRPTKRFMMRAWIFRPILMTTGNGVWGHADRARLARMDLRDVRWAWLWWAV
jgi:hypothetical protein